MNEHDIGARVSAAHNLARQEQAKHGKVEACDPPMGIDTPPKLPAWQDVLGDAEQTVRQKPLWPKFIKGTPLENDVPVWMADFALRMLQRERARRPQDFAAAPSHDYGVKGCDEVSGKDAAAEPFTCWGLSSFCAEVGHKCRTAGKCIYTPPNAGLPAPTHQGSTASADSVLGCDEAQGEKR